MNKERYLSMKKSKKPTVKPQEEPRSSEIGDEFDQRTPMPVMQLIGDSSLETPEPDPDPTPREIHMSPS